MDEIKTKADQLLLEVFSTDLDLLFSPSLLVFFVYSSVLAERPNGEFLFAQIVEKAKQDAIELASDTENRKAAMRARADARMEKAAALIVERVVNG